MPQRLTLERVHERVSCGVTQDADQGRFLRRRNELWRELRPLEPTDARFETLLGELMQLTHWPREQILKGLGLTDPS
jgi:hypothetical protein